MTAARRSPTCSASSAETAEAIRALDEHWDGYGQPRGLRGEEIPLLGRLLCLAQTAEIFHAAGGVSAACRMAKRRSGGWFDPALVEALRSIRDDAPFWRSLAEADVSAWEPGDRLLTADDASLDRIAYAFAGVIDAKSPWTYRHSDRLSVIVVGLAAALGAGAAGAAATCAARRCCTTSASSRSPTGSSTSPARSRRPSSRRFASIPS